MTTIYMDNGASYEGPRDLEKERIIILALKAFRAKDKGWEESWGPMPGEYDVTGKHDVDLDGQGK